MQRNGWEPIAELLRSSSRKVEDRKVGIEIERIGLWEDGEALHYHDRRGPKGQLRPGAATLLTQLKTKHGWETATSEDGQPLGFNAPFGKVSLEPGSQLELSTIASADLFTQIELAKKLEDWVDAVTRPWGLIWTGIGVNPLNAVDEMDVIPSTRYHIMTEYLSRRARLGTSMMRLTSSVQINLDYTSEAEGINMLRTALAATPVSYALFANSPLSGGKETGYLSYRSAIWRETDPDRTGLLPEVFNHGFSFEDYARLAWNRPLMFAQDENQHYVSGEGTSLAQIAAGNRHGVEINEFNCLNGIRQLFTEARIKPGYVEVRSIDGLRTSDRYSAIAFWVGLLYNAEARQLVLEHCSSASSDGRDALFLAATKEGLAAKTGRCEIRSLARELVKIARQTLKDRGYGEEAFLEPVEMTLEEGLNPAQRLLKEFNGPWKKDISKVIRWAGETPESL